MAIDVEQDRLERARAFDRKALAAIYDEYYPKIYRYVYRQVSEVEPARDITSELFRRFLQALQNGCGPDSHLQAWLYRTAHNLVIDHYRSRQHRQHPPLNDGMAAVEDDPEREAEISLAAEQVREALMNLTPEQQQVITLKFLAGFSNQEVATVVHRPVSAVKALQHRGLAALRRQLLPTKEKA